MTTIHRLILISMLGLFGAFYQAFANTSAGDSSVVGANQSVAEFEPEADVAEEIPAPEPSPSQNLFSQAKGSVPLKSVSISEASRWPTVVLSLFSIVFVILIFAWLAKRFGGTSLMGGRGLKIVSALPLGSKERVAVLDVNGQQFLIGVTQHQISLLHNFEQPVIETSQSTEPKGDFAAKLQALMTQADFSGEESKAQNSSEKQGTGHEP